MHKAQDDSLPHWGSQDLNKPALPCFSNIPGTYYLVLSSFTSSLIFGISSIIPWSFFGFHFLYEDTPLTVSLTFL